MLVACGLQKSQWSQSYYLNVGLHFRAQADAEHPRPEDCHLPLRADDLIASGPALQELLDFEHPVNGDDRETRVYLLLRDELSPLLIRAESVDGLAEMIADGSLPIWCVTMTARAALGLPPP